MLIVIAIAGILMGIATLNFGEWTAKANIEGQIRELYADLMNARVQAMSRGRGHIVTLEANRYSINDDSDDDGAIDAGEPLLLRKNLKAQITWTGSGSGIVLSKSGLAATARTISVPAASSAAIDCISVSTTQINMGKMNGGSCVQK